ncbi:MAG TPA: AmpG family muropeptide MFS transporter [Chromatiaceae bacterium]|nr:AmpG family muropeptide MFS transporter [Chromatiaceae bacterium]
MVAFGSATQDIAVDAFRIESAADDVQAAMASVYIMGYRIALLVAGAGALNIADAFNWHIAYLSMAALMAVGVMTVLLRPEPQRHISAQTFEQEARVQQYLLDSAHLPDWWRNASAWFVGAVVCPFVDFFVRNGRNALMLLLLVGLYKVSDLAMAAMANPLYIDLGFTLTEIASIGKLFGFAMTIVGGLIGGILVARYGIGSILVLGAVMIAATNLLFALLAQVGHSIPMLMLTISGDNLSNGLASAVFIAFLSAMTSRQYTATQYALFSSLMTLPGKFLGGFSGIVVESLGYAQFFVIASVLGIPAILLTIWAARTGAGIPAMPGNPSNSVS